MSYTDIIVILSSVFFIHRGWNQGVLRTILGPVTFIVGTLLGYIYYFYSKNFFVSLLIAIAAPIILGTLASTTFFILMRIKGVETKLSTPSCAIAATINLFWGQFWLVTTIVLLFMIPDNMIKMASLRADIERSATYQLVSPLFANLLVKDSKNKPTSLSLVSFEDPATLEKLQATPEYQQIANDKTMQDILNDPEIQAIAEKQDFGKLMTHPKILKLASDPKLMKKFMALYPKLLREIPQPQP